MSVAFPTLARNPGLVLVPLPQVQLPQVQLPLAAPDADPSFDHRWNAWIERGRRSERVSQDRLRAVLMTCAVVALLAAAIYTTGIR